jgi:hypothetical protein
MDKTSNPEFEAVSKVLRAHNIAVEKLTGDQLAEAVLQMIQAGDFTRYVQVTGGRETAQAVNYLPYREKQRLQGIIDSLNPVVEAAEWAAKILPCPYKAPEQREEAIMLLKAAVDKFYKEP